MFAMLRQHPLLGAVMPILSGIISMLEVIEPIMSLVAVAIGIVVGILTIIIKLQERQLNQLKEMELKADITLRDVKD